MPRVTVGPTTGGGWQVTGEQQTFTTQREAEQAARRQLAKGGRELVVKGRDGRIPDRSAESATVEGLNAA